jgi:hypothetical protein
MQCFRLRSSTTAVQPTFGSKWEAITIPAGALVAIATPLENFVRSDRAGFIAVNWDGKTVNMFVVDLQERGERVQGVGG